MVNRAFVLGSPGKGAHKNSPTRKRIQNKRFQDSELVHYSKQIVRLLPESQQAELWAAFQQFDQDGNGTISASEVSSVLQQLGFENVSEATEAIFKTLDVDGNGTIEWDEFSSLMAKRWLGREGLVDLEHAAALFETNDDSGHAGALSMSMMREYLCNIGMRPMSDAEFREFSAMADPDGKGYISHSEFLQMACWEPIHIISSGHETAATLALGEVS